MWAFPSSFTAALMLSAWTALSLVVGQSSTLQQCEIDMTGPMCLGEQSQVILPPALPQGLVGFWSFDDALPLDLSGNGNHGGGAVPAGPTLAGQGSSAFFHRSFLTIPGGRALQLHDFSYTFWLYLIDARPTATLAGAAAQQLCTLTRKGMQMGEAMQVAGGQLLSAAPAVFLDPKTHHLHVALTAAGPTINGEGTLEVFESNSRLGTGRWFHVAVVRNDAQRMTHLYVNGILDSSKSSSGYAMTNQGPLYVGGDPDSVASCNLPLYMDELRIYSRPLEIDEIEAEAAPSLGGIEPALVRLSCLQCGLEAALQGCSEGYHICSSRELHMGGYQVARALGWLQSGVHVWSHVTPGSRGGGQATPVLVDHKSVQLEHTFVAPPNAAARLPQATAAPSSERPPRLPLAPRPTPARGEMGLGVCCADGM